MDFKSVIDIAIGAKELANFVRDTPEARRDGGHQEIIGALRAIYFAPRGMLFLVEMLADGERPSEEQIASILPRFNDFEHIMHRYMRHIDPEDGAIRQNLTLKAQRTLREISYGKNRLRSDLKYLLNEALTFDGEISRKDAKKLLLEIQSLNAAIEEAEESLRRRLGQM